MSVAGYHFKVVDRCPDCGGRLSLCRRKKDGGQFVGCSGFPKCHFAADAGDQALRAENASLHRRIAELQRNNPSIDSSVIRKALLEIITWAHPDRHPNNNLNATEVTARLNALRKEVTE
jgi:ssDNA-binding Zn-finger/Zn-ribbon topoisomerase 1